MKERVKSANDPWDPLCLPGTGQAGTPRRAQRRDDAAAGPCSHGARQRSAGQAYVYISLVTVILTGFTGLAIDLGHVYSERRRMQNAADAGALAGAREICFGIPENAASVAWEYAVDRNGADEASISFPQWWQVEVIASTSVDTFFGSFLSLAPVDVDALATAACGSATSACGLWPIGFSLQQWLELETVGCGVPFYVWAGNNENKNPDCDVVNCDVNGDGVEDVITMLGRAWLDYSDLVDEEYPDSCEAPGCGSSELACWILHGSGGRVSLPACIAGDPGVRASMKDEVDARIGDRVHVPLFTSVGCATENHCPGSSIYAEQFGCIVVHGWLQELTLQPLDPGGKRWKDKAIKASISCGQCVTNCGCSGEQAPFGGGVNAVSLID